jgi:hypothetical protein
MYHPRRDRCAYNDSTTVVPKQRVCICVYAKREDSVPSVVHAKLVVND